MSVMVGDLPFIRAVFQAIYLFCILLLTTQQQPLLEIVLGIKASGNKKRTLAFFVLDCFTIAYAYLWMRAVIGAVFWWQDLLGILIFYPFIKWQTNIRYWIFESRTHLSRGACFVLALLAIPYVIAEVVFSVKHLKSYPDYMGFIYGHDDTYQFDPVFGYRIGPKISYCVQTFRGKVEIHSSFKGNSLGLLDKDDFGPGRSPPKTARIAVLGDSFTALEYLEENWPDRTQALLMEKKLDFHLLNFALSGMGLPNWRNILLRHIEAQNYELDAIVFAVYRDNLSRRFAYYFEEDGNFRSASALEGPPSQFPANKDEAIQRIGILHPRAWRVTESEYRGLLQGEWPERYRSKFRLEFAHQLSNAVKGVARRKKQNPECPSRTFLKHQVQMMDEIKESVGRQKIPVLVVYIPDRNEMLEPKLLESCAPYVREFADRIGAHFYNGTEVFSSLSQTELRHLYFQNDNHWNQKGSDIFAREMVNLIPRLLKKQQISVAFPPRVRDSLLGLEPRT